VAFVGDIKKRRPLAKFGQDSTSTLDQWHILPTGVERLDEIGHNKHSCFKVANANFANVSID